jgi:hypothetical protein
LLLGKRNDDEVYKALKRIMQWLLMLPN